MPDLRFIEAGVRQFLTGPEISRYMDFIGAQVERKAKDIAPRKTGEHADSIARRMRIRGDRVVVEITAATDHSLVLEARTGAMARAVGASNHGRGHRRKAVKP